MGFNHALLFTMYKFIQDYIIVLFYFDSKKNNSNFTSFKSTEIDHKICMVGVAQLVRAPGCGPGGRGFKSHHSPKIFRGIA
jgi:hypothetical protein